MPAGVLIGKIAREPTVQQNRVRQRVRPAHLPNARTRELCSRRLERDGCATTAAWVLAAVLLIPKDVDLVSPRRLERDANARVLVSVGLMELTRRIVYVVRPVDALVQ